MNQRHFSIFKIDILRSTYGNSCFNKMTKIFTEVLAHIVKTVNNIKANTLNFCLFKIHCS